MSKYNHCHYILEGKIPKEVSIFEWAKWFEKERDKRRINRTKLSNGTIISTVFVGVDLGFSSDKPLLFESMVFGEEYECMERYSNFDESINGHNKIVKELLKNGVCIIEEDGKIKEYTKFNRFEIMDI